MQLRYIYPCSLYDIGFLYCAQAGVNSLLDVARQTYKEANKDAVELVSRLEGIVLLISKHAPVV